MEVVGRLEKTADDNLWRLVERDSDHQELTTCSCGEEGAVCKALQAVESSGHAQQRNGHQSLRR